MAPVKRGSKAQGGRAAKLAKPDPVSAHITAVVNAIHRAPTEAIPASLKALLSTLVEGSCGTVASERHEYQTRVVAMLEQTLQDVEAHMKKDVDMARVKVDAVSGDRAARQEALGLARSKLQESEAGEAQRKEAVAAAKADHAARVEELKAQRKAQAGVDAPFQGTLSDIEAVKRALEALASLKAAAFESKKMKVVLDVGRRFNMDSSLLESFVHVIKKEPSARVGFDEVVVQNLGEGLSKLLEGLEATLASGEAPRAEAAAATAAAEAAAGAAEAAVAAAKAALHDAEQEVKAGAAAVRAAQKALSRWLPDAKAVMDAYDALVARAGGFASVLQAFAALRDLAPEPAADDLEPPAAAVEPLAG